MRMIRLPKAATPSLWAVPVQALAPWVIHFTLHRAAITSQPCLADTSENSSSSTRAVRRETPGPACKTAATTRPCSRLRVVRESDSSISPDCAGRMVISGRMADVCAELDRMALHATADP